MFNYKFIFIFKILFCTASLIHAQQNSSSLAIVTATGSTTAATATNASSIVSTTATTNSTASSTVSTTPLTSTTVTTTASTTLSECGVASSICNKNGNCTLAGTVQACVCNTGYKGNNCEWQTCTVDNQCLNNGDCYENVLTKDRKCECKDSFTGALCEKPLCIGYCYNNGVCNFDVTTNTRTCNCLERFYGLQCQFDYCFNDLTNCKPEEKCYLYRSNSKCLQSRGLDCDRHFCNSNGACQYENHELTCKCNTGYSGPTCRTDDCRGYCFNEGVCLRNQSQTVTCSCTAQFEGDRCEREHVILAPHPHRTSIAIYLIVVTILVAIIAIGTYVYKNGGTSFLRQSYENVSYRLRSTFDRSSQSGGSRIPYVQTRNKPTDESYTDPFS